MSITTISDLLYTPTMKGIQSDLAIYLNVNRATVKKYLADVKGADHEIRLYNGKYELMARIGK